MEGWTEQRIGDLFNIKAGGDLQEAFYSPCITAYAKWAIYANSLENKGLYGYTSKPRFKGDAVTITGRGDIGHAEYRSEDFDAIVRLLVLLPKVDVNCRYVTYYINSLVHFPEESTGVPQLTAPKVKHIKINIPISTTEQTAIANILSKVDEAIAAVQNSIDSAERLKKGLMQNLLTGKMKPDGTFRTAEEFYIDEKFGKVPVGWKCDKFKEFAVLQRGNDLTDNEVIPGSYPVVKSNGVSIWHNQFFVEPPGVVTGRSGTIGKAFYIEERFWAHNTTLYVKDFKGNVPKYIYYLILSMDFSRYYAGTTVPTLNRNDIHKLKVIIPSETNVQQQIVDRIDAAISIIQEKQQKIATLERLKKSLMQNLLTGKVRVKY